MPAFQKLGRMLTRHLDGILNYCHEKVPFGTVEAINGNIRAMLRRGRGYRLCLSVWEGTVDGRDIEPRCGRDISYQWLLKVFQAELH